MASPLAVVSRSGLRVEGATLDEVIAILPDRRMILGASRAVRVYAYPEAVGLRKGYDGLFGLVKQGLGRDPLSGDLFLFVNARRKGCKVSARLSWSASLA
jgi:hypothetical protein